MSRNSEKTEYIRFFDGTVTEKSASKICIKGLIECIDSSHTIFGVDKSSATGGYRPEISQKILESIFGAGFCRHYGILKKNHKLVTVTEYFFDSTVGPDSDFSSGLKVFYSGLFGGTFSNPTQGYPRFLTFLNEIKLESIENSYRNFYNKFKDSDYLQKAKIGEITDKITHEIFSDIVEDLDSTQQVLNKIRELIEKKKNPTISKELFCKIFVALSYYSLCYMWTTVNAKGREDAKFSKIQEELKELPHVIMDFLELDHSKIILKASIDEEIENEIQTIQRNDPDFKKEVETFVGPYIDTYVNKALRNGKNAGEILDDITKAYYDENEKTLGYSTARSLYDMASRSPSGSDAYKKGFKNLVQEEERKIRTIIVSVILSAMGELLKDPILQKFKEAWKENYDINRTSSDDYDQSQG